MKKHLFFAVAVLIAATLACNMNRSTKSATVIKIVSVLPENGNGAFELGVEYTSEPPYDDKISCDYASPDGVYASLGEYTPTTNEGWWYQPFTETIPGHYQVSCVTSSGAVGTEVFDVAEMINIIGNAGVAGATLSGYHALATADDGGFYLVRVMKGWSGTITPSLAGYSFEPASRSYDALDSDQTGQNFTAISTSSLMISGNAGVAGVTLTYPGGSVTSDAGGFYLIMVSSGWSGTVTPSLAGYTFDPPSMPYTNVTENQVGQNYTPITPLTGGRITYDEASEVLAPHKAPFSYYPSQHHKWCGITLVIDSLGNISGSCSATGDQIPQGGYGTWMGDATIEGSITGMAIAGGSFTFTETLTENFHPGDSFLETFRQVVITGTGSFVSAMRASGTATMSIECHTAEAYPYWCADDYSPTDAYTGTINWTFDASASPLP